MQLQQGDTLDISAQRGWDLKEFVNAFKRLVEYLYCGHFVTPMTIRQLSWTASIA